MAAEPPDTEVLDGSPFMSGGWHDGSISLGVGFSQVAEALGDGAPLLSVTPETLLAIAFSCPMEILLGGRFGRRDRVHNFRPEMSGGVVTPYPLWPYEDV